MSDIPGAIEFLTKVFHASLSGAIPWETTADPKVLIGQLEGDYSLKLEKVPSFDEEDSEPDYVLSLQSGRKIVMKLDRREFDNDEITRVFKAQGFQYAHFVFVELWRRAYYKATKISDALQEANQILDRMLEDAAF
jgi:hypothetical protein